MLSLKPRMSLRSNSAIEKVSSPTHGAETTRNDD
jgi:hypothetical protein